MSTPFFKNFSGRQQKEPQTVAALSKKFFQSDSTKCKEIEKTLQKVL
jgi:hypothetical protein